MRPDDILPHAFLYTRLRPSPGKGIGVFAIRAIPRGIDPFHGDSHETVLVPLDEVQKVEEQGVKAMYLDFCPLSDGHFLAPRNFNDMSIAWYMNHSDRPNMTTDEKLNFLTKESIQDGVELTIDYTTFSDHAKYFIERWKADLDGR